MVLQRTRLPLGFSLLEVLASLAVLLAGVVMILWFFPRTLHASAEAGFLSEAALLAQMKAAEIRRDDDTSGTLTFAIAARTTPTTPIPFAQEPSLSYSFSGQSILYSDSPRGDPNVARVIISYSAGYNPTGGTIYELRFAH